MEERRMSHVRCVLGLFLFAAVPVVGGWSSCEPNLDKDPSFDRWCGPALCYWQTDAGSIERVPTWHPDDYGVELVGTPAAVSQRIDVPPFSAPNWCFRFDTLADIDPNTTVMLQLDYEDDGSIEYETPVAGNDWAAVEVLLPAPTWYQAVRFRLYKTGLGRAVVAHLQVTASTDCTTAPPQLVDRPTGAYCETDEQCQSGICADGQGHSVSGGGVVARGCGSCRTSAGCQTGEVCRMLESGVGSHRECAPPAEPGASCLDDSDCASGSCGPPFSVNVCTGTVFVTCETDGDCQQVMGSGSTCDWPGLAQVCS
jgi:hypothetical protein